MIKGIRDELQIAKKHWKNYVFQSLLATVSIFCVLIFLEQDEEVIIASLGATAFVVFALPDKITAQPRNVIGGHIVGMACGVLGFHVLNAFPDPDFFVAESVIHAIAVGLSIFIMVLTNTEHPPAAGTALGVAIEGLSRRLALSILLFSFVFTLIRLLLRKHLRDLT